MVGKVAKAMGVTMVVTVVCGGDAGRNGDDGNGGDYGGDGGVWR